ncbi:MAG: hypothetical protein JWN40_5024 [Phycisphaerales bacterium]|nr:hypothetical protein [Phycisphaerales bacterium]
MTQRLFIFGSMLLFQAAAGSFASAAQPQPVNEPAIAVVKPWVEDFAAFASASGAKQWIVGRADAPCLSEAESFEAASRDACAQLLARMRQRLARSNDARNEEWLQRRLAQELAVGSIVTDRSVSRIRRPYGEIWSEAILVDASSNRLAKIERDYSTWLNQRQQAKRSAAVSIAGLSLVILGIYAGLNAVTKGYFRGRLRTGAAVMMIFGLLVAISSIRALG